MNLKQANTIGQGAMFPIVLSTQKNKEGNAEYTDMIVNGTSTQVKKVGWYPAAGLDLIKNNITSIFIYQIGQKFRQENFGSRLWECIEEPSTDILEYMATKFVQDSLIMWETRISGLSVDCIREESKLYIRIRFSVDSDSTEAIIEYDKSTNSTYAY